MAKNRTHLTLDELESRLRPGGWSEVGFLGVEDDLDAVLKQDAAVVDRLSTTHEELAYGLVHILERALSRRWARTTTEILRELAEDGWEPRVVQDALQCSVSVARSALDALDALGLGSAESLSAADLAMRVQNAYCVEKFGNLRVVLGGSRGIQECPWGCRSSGPGEMSFDERVAFALRDSACHPPREILPESNASLDFGIRHRSTDVSITGGGLLGHLILEHRFFEGPGSPYRVEPEDLARLVQANQEVIIPRSDPSSGSTE